MVHSPNRCIECGAAFKKRAYLTRHSRIHDPYAKRYACPYDGCGYSSLEKANVSVHINAKHTFNKLFYCRFGSGCIRSYLDPTSRCSHEKIVHKYVHWKAGKGKARAASKANDPEEETSILLPTDDAVSPVSSLESEEDMSDVDAQDASRASTLPGDLSDSYGSLKLPEFRPTLPGSAERPVLPGVKAILGECRSLDAYTRCVSRTAPVSTLFRSSEHSVPREREYGQVGDASSSISGDDSSSSQSNKTVRPSTRRPMD